MKVCILYRPNSEYARSVEEFIHNFRFTYPDHRLEVLNIDTRDGAAMASLYDIMQYPSIIAITNDGQIIKSWSGDLLPLVSEVAYYTEPDLALNR